MKRNFVLLLVLLYNLMSVIAAGLESGKKYRIESNFDLNSYQRSGALGLGSYHNGSSTSFYVKDGNFTEDCWWTFEQQSDGTYYIKNCQSGEYMSAVKKWEDIKMISTPAKNACWNISEECGHTTFFVNGDETLMLFFGNTHKDEEYATTDKRETTVSFYLFNIYDEEGSLVDAMNFSEKKYCGTNADIPDRISLISKYASDIKINGKLIFSTIDYKERFPSYWLASKPNSGKLVIDGTLATAGTVLRIMDGETVLENGEDIQTDKNYTLEASVNGVKAASSTIKFTTMPIIDIRHEGKIASGMHDYVWGEISISSMEEPNTVVLSSRFKSRGATASKYGKQSMNVKLRNRDTDKEEDSTLLGLRSSSSWILDAMAIDRVNMRNRVCFDLWNEYSKLPYETKFGSRSGTIGKFVELIENGEYKGIYCLTDRINRKLLDLKKSETDSTTGVKSPRGVLYKSASWDYTGLKLSEMNDYIGLYGDTRNSTFWCNWNLMEPEDLPGEAAWAPLKSLYANEGDLAYYKNNFYIDNVRDYHLFIIALQILDNGNKNEFLAIQNIKKVGENKARLIFCPWDLDASLSGNFDGTAVGGEFFESNIKSFKINQNYPFSAFLKDDEYFANIKARWKDVRTNVLSKENIVKKMTNYANEFISSGAWERESTIYGNDFNKNGCALVADLYGEIDAIGNWYKEQILRVDDFFGVYHVGYDNISADQENSNQIYDIFGRKLKEAPERGIFIRGGKANLIVK